MANGPLYKNRYRVASIRWSGWDYSQNGAYFITICTKNRVCYFGNVVNGEMVLSDIGNVAQKCWLDIPNHFPFVMLDEFVVMPNHVHGIIVIKKNVITSKTFGPQTVETQNFASLQQRTKPWHKNTFGSQSKNIPSIIRGFKIGVTKYAKQHDQSFAWQPRYHDRVIRDEYALNRIRIYIRNNPKKWEQDRLFSNK